MERHFSIFSFFVCDYFKFSFPGISFEFYILVCSTFDLNSLHKPLQTKTLYFQLLAATLQVEKPELEVRRTELLRQEEDLKVQLVNLEDHLLTTLAESQGNILENKVHFFGIIP